MRTYAQIKPQFWIGETGRAIRAAGVETQLVALYLMTCPLSNMIGLYYLPLPTLCHETGLAADTARSAIRRLHELDFATYDEGAEVVWVHRMACYQVAERLLPRDKRHSAVVALAETYRKSAVFTQFRTRYADVFNLSGPASPCPSRAPSRPLHAPFQAPTVPLRSKEQENDQEPDTEATAARRGDDAPADHRDLGPAAFPVFDCVGGRRSQERRWALTPEHVAELQAAFPSLDVEGECRKAWTWTMAAATNRKTANGMPGFLFKWMGRVQDRGLSRSPASPIGGAGRLPSPQQQRIEAMKLQRNGADGGSP